MRVIQRRSLGIAIGLIAACASPWTAATFAEAPTQAQATQTKEYRVLIAAPADPSLHGFVASVKHHPYFAANAGRISVVEVSAGAMSSGDSTGATVSVYHHGAGGFRAVGTRAGFTQADQVAQWVASLDGQPTVTQATRTDPELVRTNWDKSLPTPQATPQMPYVPSQTPPPQPQPQPQVTQPSSVPMMMVPQQSMMVPQQTVQMMSLAPASAPANVIQAPSQNYIIQQSPPQFFFAQQSQAAPASLAPAAMAPASMAPANLFMPASVAPASTPAPMSMAPASLVPAAMAPASNMAMMAVAPAPSMPMMAVAPASNMAMMAVAPSAVAPSAVATSAAAPAVSGAAVTTQSVSIPASSTRSRVRVRGPGPLAAFAARIGERLTTLGRTRIETIQETNLETQTSAPPPGQVVTLSSTSASPVMAPQQNFTIPTSVPVSPPSAPPFTPTPPQGPHPSPQGQEQHHFLHHD